jgi:hypothetical protein
MCDSPRVASPKIATAIDVNNILRFLERVVVPDEVVSVVDSFLFEVCLKVSVTSRMLLRCLCGKGRSEDEVVSRGDQSICILVRRVVLKLS